MARFGILGDLVGQRVDFPSIKLPDVLVSEESRSVMYFRGAMRRLPGRMAAMAGAQTLDGFPILRYHYHESVAGLEYVFGFTKAHAYLWNEGTSAWDLMFTCASNCLRWSTEDFGEYVVATNNLDKVQYWKDSTPATPFAPLGGVNGICYDTAHYLTKAEYVICHWSYLHLFSTQEDGTDFLNLDRWCSAGDITDWDETHAGGGDANYRELGPNDHITGVGIYDVQGANQLICFTQHSVNAAWLVTDELVYETHEILAQTGCISADSIVQTPDGQLWYMSTDDVGVKQIRRVYDPTPLSYDVQSALDLMHPTLCDYVTGSYIGQFQQIWWSIPSGGASTGNDLVLIYSLQTQTWQSSGPMDIAAFGYWTNQTAIHIDDITTLIDDMSGTIDSYAPVAGVPVLLVSDYDGYTWSISTGTTDKGAAYDGTLVLALNFTPELINRFKRVHGAWFLFLSHAGTAHTAVVSLKSGDSAQYVNKGTVSLDGDGQMVRRWIRFDSHLRYGHLKIIGANPFEFVGCIMDYDFTGERL